MVHDIQHNFFPGSEVQTSVNYWQQQRIPVDNTSPSQLEKTFLHCQVLFQVLYLKKHFTSSLCDHMTFHFFNGVSYNYAKVSHTVPLRVPIKIP